MTTGTYHIAVQAALGNVATATVSVVPVPIAVVHFVYLVPADATARAEYPPAAATALLDMQAWYLDEVGAGKTFQLSNPIVEVYQTPHNQDWYNTNQAETLGTDTFETNATQDGFALTGGRGNDPKNVYLFAIDALRNPDQIIGGAGGVALVDQSDVEGLIQEIATKPTNERWQGGLAHEAGHAFGLSHPAVCGVNPAASDCQSLMYFGYQTYPNTFLIDSDKAALAASSYFVTISNRSVRLSRKRGVNVPNPEGIDRRLRDNIVQRP